MGDEPGPEASLQPSVGNRKYVESHAPQEAPYDDLQAGLARWGRERGLNANPVAAYLWVRCAGAQEVPCLAYPLHQIAALMTGDERIRTLAHIEDIERACRKSDPEV